MSPRKPDYLLHILEAADSVADILRQYDYEQVSRTRLLRSALMFEAIVIGEASAHLSAGLHARYADVPWSDIIGLRHVIVHGYFAIDWNRLWGVLTNRVPVLRNRVAIIVATEYPGMMTNEGA
jgi:uncharacterized protein with HEPN domain